MKEENPASRIGEILADQKVVITGAGSGIGRATAYACASEGAAILAADINAETAEQTAQTIRDAGGHAIARAGDVGDSATCDGFASDCVNEWGRLSGWVNNAAYTGGAAPLLETTDAEWQKMQSATLGGVFFGCRSAIRSMLQSGGGAIVNISSGAGLAAEPVLSAYGAAKAGVASLTRSAAVEYAGQGIRANCIAPGPIDTPGMSDWADAFPGGRHAFEAQVPQQRLGRPEEIANAVVFLLSPRASYVNGTVLEVDGGIRARLAGPRPPTE